MAASAVMPRSRATPSMLESRREAPTLIRFGNWTELVVVGVARSTPVFRGAGQVVVMPSIFSKGDLYILIAN